MAIGTTAEQNVSRQVPWEFHWNLLRRLGSLRLTVVLFALSIVLVLVGTLAQVDQTMWDVLQQYFRCWVAMVPLDVFLPVTFFPNAPQLPSWLAFPFPGGWTLGVLLAINLVAAHATRFRVTAKGRQLVTGLVLSGLAWLLAIFFVVAAQGDRIQDEPLISSATLWQVLRWAVIVSWATSVMITLRSQSPLDFWLKAVASLALGGLAFFVFVYGQTSLLGESSLRIVWQLGQGLLAALVLWWGSARLFGPRAGIIVIHSGVALLMFGELLVSMTAVEESLFIKEQQVATFARQTNQLELAFVDRSAEDYDEVTAIDLPLHPRDGLVIRHESLPVDVEIVKYLENARLEEVQPSSGANMATAGVGMKWMAREVRGSSGASGGELDMAAVYVRLIPKASQGEVHTHLLAQQLNDSQLFLGADQDFNEQIVADARPYEVALRFRRNPKPYSIKLEDIRKEDYLGTSTPRDYSSYVVLNHPENGIVDRDIRIWMNNPLRYHGETFYQTNYARAQDGTEISTLSVVTNTGWMIPYIACMFALVGMTVHFSKSLSRFISRMAREATGDNRNWGLGAVLAAVAVFGVALAWGMRVPSVDEAEVDLVSAGKLPVVSEGRLKPLDTVARNALKVISLKQQVSYTDDQGESRQVPAIKWLLDVATRPDYADATYPIFRIDNMDVQSLLHLEPRKRFRYTLGEFSDHLDTLQAEAARAYQVQQEDATRLTLVDRKIIEVFHRVKTYEGVRDSFRTIPYPARFTELQRAADPEGAEQRDREILSLAMEMPRLNAVLMSMRPPLTVPVTSAGAEPQWLPYAAAKNQSTVAAMFQHGGEYPAIDRWTAMLDTYRNQDWKDFNLAVAGYRNFFAEDISTQPLTGVDLEVFYNRLAPFSIAIVLYFVAFLATAIGWLGWFQPLRRFAFWLLILAFALHTVALIARMYISGRPPVTDLHSSAIFIGWGGVLFCIVLEAIYRLSLGNAVAAAMGFATLLISDRLALEGDTFTVMQAVLDTQFWLATHVVCITLGYSATFLAGMFGIAYIGVMLVNRWWPDRDMDAYKRMLSRTIYGSVCFALLFSFVGTVLGGLWADDSWGRFWGWDPKENGALIIVLWNALVLHARWGGMIRERGLACLAVLGNVATAWSWFGVNELQVGLHSYGFTEGAVQRLLIFCTAMVAIAAAGWLLSRPGTPLRPAAEN